ncbi:MAG: baseplate J/gp47 family protein, partial [Gammaproteobacteria bacterium]
PIHYTLELPMAGTHAGEVTARRSGTATGERIELIAATGSVTFYNWNLQFIQVPAGTGVAAGQVDFVTTQTVVVPGLGFSGITPVPGAQSAAITAVEPGPSGNVAAGAIDTITDQGIRNQLRAIGNNPNRLVENADATSGGGELPHPVITEEDVAALVDEIETQLAASLATRLGSDPERVYAAPQQAEIPEVDIPDALVGTEDLASFTLSGTLAYDRPYVARDDVLAAAASRLLADPAAPPTGMQVLASGIETDVGAATLAGQTVAVAVQVRATAAAIIDADAVRTRSAGLTTDEAEATLADLGTIEVELWPGWVDRVPGLGFRVTVEAVVP